jgi:hypothetical protein
VEGEQGGEELNGLATPGALVRVMCIADPRTLFMTIYPVFLS